MNSGFNKYDLWQIARPRIMLISILSLMGLVLTYGITFLMTPIYQARVILLPVEHQTDSTGILGLVGGIGDIASLAGIAGPPSTKVEALETLTSRAFVQKFIVNQSIVDELLSESELKDLESIPVSDRTAIKYQRATKKFLEEVLDVNLNNRTGVVQLSVFWKDAELAAAWANSIADEVNVTMREQAKLDVRLRLEHLQSEASKSSVTGVQAAIYKVMESDIKNLAIASATEEFAFKVIDPAIVPETDDFVRPNRIALAFIGFLLTVFVCLVVLSVRYRSSIGG